MAGRVGPLDGTGLFGGFGERAAGPGRLSGICAPLMPMLRRF